MAIDRAKFFAGVRSAMGPLHDGQVNGMTRILDQWEARRLTDIRFLAYMLATVWHETACTMQPIRERGSEAYLRKKPYYPYVGEGLVQVTWKAGYAKFDATHPGDLLQWPLALKALFDGMTDGMFTRYALKDFFSATKDDPTGARKIINGTDKAGLIAGYHRSFLKALS